jgi:hypothetical protein
MHKLDKAGTVIAFSIITLMGACGSLVVKAVGYKPEGRGFETR